MTARSLRVSKVLAVVAAIAPLGVAGPGCLSLKGQAALPQQAYVLEGTRAAAAPSAPEAAAAPGAPEAPPESCLLLRVAEPDAAPGLATTRMAYVREPHRVEYYADNRWVDAPAAMLAPLLVQTLSRSGLFGVVVPQSAPVARADLLLVSELLELTQVFQAGGGSEGHVAVRVTLLTADGSRVLASRTLRATEPAPHDDPYGGVVAANRAIDRILEELTTWLRGPLAAATGDALACDREDAP
jgi:cholesterol transport system auxiliary component